MSFDNKYIQDKKNLFEVVNDMYETCTGSAKNTLEFGIGDFYALREFDDHPKDTPIKIPIEAVSQKDYKKQLDELVNLLYMGDKLSTSSGAVHGLTDGYKKQRNNSMYHLKYLKRFYEEQYGSKYSHPNLEAVLNGEFHKVLDFMESENKTGKIVDLAKYNLLTKKFFADTRDMMNTRRRCEEEVGEGIFVDLEDYKDDHQLSEDFVDRVPKGLGWLNNEGRLFFVSRQIFREITNDDTHDFTDKKEELDKKYKIDAKLANFYEENKKTKAEDEEESEDEDENEDEEETKDALSEFEKRAKELDEKYKVKF